MLNSFQQLNAHQTEAEKLKEYFADNLTGSERSNYDFLQDTPKNIINSLYKDLQGFNLNNNLHSLIGLQENSRTSSLNSGKIS